MTPDPRAVELVNQMKLDATILDGLPDLGWASIKAAELEQAIATALADGRRREAEQCAKDVCMDCGGRALGYLPVSGPNQAGNHVRENNRVTGDHVICRASGIYSRLKTQAGEGGVMDE